MRRAGHTEWRLLEPMGATAPTPHLKAGDFKRQKRRINRTQAPSPSSACLLAARQGIGGPEKPSEGETEKWGQEGTWASEKINYERVLELGVGEPLGAGDRKGRATRAAGGLPHRGNVPTGHPGVSSLQQTSGLVLRSRCHNPPGC